ncbi:MAG TPA: hypothetical protein VIW92_13770 [Thermoanaerobaculia bacterium]
MPNVPYAAVMREWEVLLTGVAANAADLPFVAEYRTQLEAELTGVKEAIQRQTALQAAFQQETRVVEGFLERGKVLAVNVKAGIRTRYGNRSDKLVEFGMRPLRSRRRATSEVKRKRKEKEEEEKAAPQTSTTAEPQS